MFFDELIETNKVKCRGIIYRADVQHCNTTRGVLFSVRLNKLKKMSCPGCINCRVLEYNDLPEISNDWPLIGIEKCKHGKLYTIVYDVYRDWETGYIDSWDLQVVEFKEKEDKKDI